MTAFVLLSEYTAPIEEVDNIRPEHLLWVQQQVESGRLIVAGRRHPVTGGVIIIEAENEMEVGSIVMADPYVVSGVARYQTIPFDPAFSRQGIAADLGIIGGT